MSTSSFLDGDLMSAAAQRKTARTARISSWDQSGLNEDAFVVLPGETAVLADIEGPGKLTHLWFVQTCRRILVSCSRNGQISHIDSLRITFLPEVLRRQLDMNDC